MSELEKHFGHKIEVTVIGSECVITCITCRKVLEPKVCPEDGCVVNYKGRREQWCSHAAQDSKRLIISHLSGTGFVLVRCRKLNKEVVAAYE